MTILIVDADRAGLEASRRLVLAAGYRVVTATSFDEASALMAHIRPDGLIADIRLGAYNGLHLVFRARVTFPRVAAIVTDSTFDPMLAADAEAMDVTYLVKPLTEAAILLPLRARLGGIARLSDFAAGGRHRR